MLSICEFNDLACNYFMAAVLVVIPSLLLLVRGIVRRKRARTSERTDAKAPSNSPPDWPW